MFSKQKLISTISIIVGTVLIIVGLFSAGFYVKTVIDSLSQADQSLIFWFLIFLFMGIGLLAVGIFFIITGVMSLRGNVSAYKVVKYSLIVFVIVLSILIISIIINSIKLEKNETHRTQQEEIESYLNDRMQKIKLIEITDNDEIGFKLLIKTTGGLEGKYALQISINDEQATFLELAESINFDSNIQTIQKKVDYINLFQKCFNELKESNVYVCVESAGTSGIKFEINAKLILIEDNEEKMKNLDNNYNLEQSNVETEFIVDTFTKDGKVVVEKFRLGSTK